MITQGSSEEFVVVVVVVFFLSFSILESKWPMKGGCTLGFESTHNCFIRHTPHVMQTFTGCQNSCFAHT